MENSNWQERLLQSAPRVHCITNPVTMQDVANILLAAGGSAIMAQDPKEVQEITAICHATLLNLGVPDEEKFRACTLAGLLANELGHPVILDPVGVGASHFRQQGMETLLKEVQPSVIRCNQEEALTLLRIGQRFSGHMGENASGDVESGAAGDGISGGVESGIMVGEKEQAKLACRLARTFDCTAFISGKIDVISDGVQSLTLEGGDERITRITGSGCMLSALCGLFCGTGMDAYEAACMAGKVWKESSCMAGHQTDCHGGGIGTFHMYLFDALDGLCHGFKEEKR